MLNPEEDIAQRIRKLSENALEQFNKTIEQNTEVDDLYVIEESLGEGAFASVYRGRRLTDNKQVALKILPQNNITEWSKEKSEVFPTEVIIHRSLHHPNIIQLLEVLKVNSSYVLVLETDYNFALLFDIIKERKRIHEKEAKIIFRQMVDAIKYCMDSSIWHRDIKAENVLVHNRTLAAKLIDFGCASRTDQPDFRKEWPGTLEYCPPEYFGQRTCGSESSTLWSLGVLLSFMVNGKLPFTDVNEILTKGLVRNPRISTDLSSLFLSLLEKDPKKRITMNDLLIHPWLQRDS